MNGSFKTGVSFGLTSGVITTLGLIVGLYATTGSKQTVLAGILTIAIADSLADALGIHVSEEVRGVRTHREVWVATIFTFLTKFSVSLTFIIPILLLQLSTAILTSVLWGLFLTIIFNFYLAKRKKENPLKVIGEHLLIGIAVILITNFVGNYISTLF